MNRDSCWQLIKDANLKKEKGDLMYFYTIAMNSECWIRALVFSPHQLFVFFPQQSHRLLTFTTDLPGIYYDINILF